MDCLYLFDAYRGFGIGEHLVNKMKDFGREKGIELIQWQTPDFNTRAIKFYKRIGAERKSKERFFLKIE
ncbi:MAG: GNAT family N-acetyltransferase [Bacteroidota bacterium]